MGEVAEHREDEETQTGGTLPCMSGISRGKVLPLPLGEVAERSEDGEGHTLQNRQEGPLSHLR